MLTGKWVPFNVGFVDVESLPKPNVVNDQNLTAYTVFEDVDSPKGFRIFVKDKNGNRAAGTVDWAAIRRINKEKAHGYFMERSGRARQQDRQRRAAIKTMLDALAEMDFTGITGIPAT